MLKKFLSSLRAAVPNTVSTAGFTMIELLVVIAVIGVLAVAVLSSINPIEQINKGRDTRTRSDAAQLINAVDRYYAIHEDYPFNTATGGFTPQDVDPAEAFSFDGETDNWDWVDHLVDTAEVKEGFTNRLKNDALLVVFKAADTNATMYACFKPTSQAFKLEAARHCEDGTTPDGGTASVPAGIDPCTTTDGTLDDDNMICLP